MRLLSKMCRNFANTKEFILPPKSAPLDTKIPIPYEIGGMQIFPPLMENTQLFLSELSRDPPLEYLFQDIYHEFLIHLVENDMEKLENLLAPHMMNGYKNPGLKLLNPNAPVQALYSRMFIGAGMTLDRNENLEALPWTESAQGLRYGCSGFGVLNVVNLGKGDTFSIVMTATVIYASQKKLVYTKDPECGELEGHVVEFGIQTELPVKMLETIAVDSIHSKIIEEAFDDAACYRENWKIVNVDFKVPSLLPNLQFEENY